MEMSSFCNSSLCEGLFTVCLTLLSHLRLLTSEGGKNPNPFYYCPGTSAFIPNIQPGHFLLRE